MIRDRGNIKWNAMMLPEHLSELRKWGGEDDLVERPKLTEWDLQIIQEELDVALKRKSETLVRTWVNGRIIPYQGVIEGIDSSAECVMLQDPFEIERLYVSDIVSVHCVD
ncbi:YolD-like family protein [Sporosarcina limicola]|uniref:YolD-like family protein n=1 Tax=Sporosarcina limicola TaxID=34101 RepID=A0A927MLQ5_9BACL|nr:YolD-like family protein [Sporosarcina limicola]MBE1556913.1 hypothetical protein [Sporosarcina limicola]